MYKLAGVTKTCHDGREARSRYCRRRPGLAERLAANLVGSAIRHNLTGGWITVATESSEGHAVLTVANSGRTVGRAGRTAGQDWLAMR